MMPFSKISLSVLMIAGCFFILFGVYLLIAAYQLNDPLLFVMTFFASNLIILISAVLTLGFAIRLFRSERNGEEPPDKKQGEG